MNWPNREKNVYRSMTITKIYITNWNQYQALIFNNY